MKYIQMISAEDDDIPYLLSVHRMPEIFRFISIDEENYFRYVTETENVFFYKVFAEHMLVGCVVHCELWDKTLYLSLLVIPSFQNKKIGTEILRDIQNGVLTLDYNKIEVSVDCSNEASLRLFWKMNFIRESEEDELINFSFCL